MGFLPGIKTWSLKPSTRRKIGMANAASRLGLTHSVETKKRMSLAKVGNKSRLGQVRSVEERRKVSKAMTKLWQNLEFRSNIISGQLLARLDRPNQAEAKLLELLQCFSGWEYVGDGSLVIGGLSPDFINTNKNLVIELYGNYWHEGEDENFRREAFALLGYKALIVWEEELNDGDSLLFTICDFMHGGAG